VNVKPVIPIKEMQGVPVKPGHCYGCGRDDAKGHPGFIVFGNRAEEFAAVVALAILAKAEGPNMLSISRGHNWEADYCRACHSADCCDCPLTVTAAPEEITAEDRAFHDETGWWPWERFE
jgi:hypothetical protein